MKTKDISSKLTKVYDDRARIWPIFRPAHALLTGLPDPEAPLKETTPLRLLATDLAWLGAFTLLSTGGIHLAALGGIATAAGGLATLTGILGATGRLRRLIVGHVHEATHGIVAKFYRKRGDSKRLARRKAEFILDLGTVLTFTQNGQAYRREHARHHTFANLGTIRDPDGGLLHDWGIWPGKTDNLYRSLLTTVVNPLWHMDAFARRLKSNLFEGKPYRRALGALALTAFITLAFVLPLPVWLVAIALPFGPLLHIASLLQVITEHPYGGKTPAKTFEAYVDLTWERIPWTPLPDDGAPLKKWVIWWAILPIHIASRLAVLDDTMIAHGHHHRAWPLGVPFLDWYNTAARWVKTVYTGITPPKVDDRITEGLIGALARQKAYFKKQKL